MGSHIRCDSKLAFDAIRSFASKIVPKNLIQKPTPKVNQYNSSIPISRNLFPQFVPKQSPCSPFLVGARNFYYVDGHQVQHFRPRGTRGWFQNPRTLFTVVLVGSGVLVTIYFGNLETVPYTKRKHLVLVSKSVERRLGESQFQQMKGTFKGKILPAIHPESVRIRLISKDIIEALQRGLKQDEKVWSDPGYAMERGGETHAASDRNETLMALSESGEGKWNRDEEILDDKWVEESRRKGKECGATGHLEGLNWEVLVVNEPAVNAFCLPGGKIVVFTGLLEHFRTDPEIATIIGHEVGHVVARHGAEGITKNLWMETEADYVGILLVASAGYDPRVAPKVYQKLDKITGDSALKDYLSTHPSGKKRAQLLAQAKVMEEAITIYKGVQSGRGVEGFL